jgi:gas vesicle protein
MNRFVTFLAGSMMGAAVGAALALLFTPYSGEELREMAREAAYAKREQMEARLRELRAPHHTATLDEEV